MLRTVFLFLCALWFPVLASTQEALPKIMPYSYLLTDRETPTPALSRLLFLLGVPHETNLDSIVAATQTRWVQNGKERWEFEPYEEDKKAELVPIFKQIGLFETINASDLEYDYALIYGGFYSRVVKRLEHLISEYERGVRFKKIVLLTGQRFLDHNTDEKQLPLQTETEMMLFVFENALMPEGMRKIPLQLIDAPRQLANNGNWVRPTTKDTLIEWLNTQPAPGRCLFVSSQPFCGYQDSVAKTYLPSDFIIETIGIESGQDLPVSIHLDNLARWLYQEQIRRKGNR